MTDSFDGSTPPSDHGLRLGDRYDVGGLLGRGGMADVRVGQDLRLGRTVAIKRLRSDLASDPTFQARFRREAQSAASLNHPSIVAVYDTGEQVTPDGHTVPYIVMELVEGQTLRDVLREDRKILPERALEITADVLAALDYSHRAGIVHRDIKPANVMLTPAGQVKVMDFGIARAIADSSSAMTQTAAVVGTAQYLSPEQARGEAVDARSDIYSTGCLLYELLTGRPPFVGDSPVAVAYQHVREEPVPPSALNPELSRTTDTIVLRALAKRTDERYQSAADMRADIERALAGAQVDAPTTAVPAVAAALPTPAADPGTSTFAATPLTVPTAEEPEEPRRRWWPWVLLLLVVLAVVGGVGYVLASGGGDDGGGGEETVTQVAVPDVSGASRSDATRVLENRGFTVAEDVQRQSDADVEQGLVLGTDPEQGAQADQGSRVTLILSRGPEPVEVDSVVGFTIDRATSVLRDQGLDVNPISQESSEDADEVLSTDPVAGEEVEPGSTVNVYYSEGEIEVPDVTDFYETRALNRLEKDGFEPLPVTTSDSDEPEGAVVSTSPVAGESLPPGSTVTITISDPPDEPTDEPTTEEPTDPTDTPTTDEPTTELPTAPTTEPGPGDVPGVGPGGEGPPGQELDRD